MANGNLTANLVFDLVWVEVVFGPDGVELKVHSQPGLQQPGLAGVLASISEDTRPARKASLERAAMEIGKVPADQKDLSRKDAFRRIAESRDWGNLSSIAFIPQANKILISRARATQLIFWSKDTAWLFDPPGLFLDRPLDPAIGTLTDPQIIDGQTTVLATFLPNPQAPITQFKYNLRLITGVQTNGVYDGHAIIIVDPIIETSKQ